MPGRLQLKGVRIPIPFRQVCWRFATLLRHDQGLEGALLKHGCATSLTSIQGEFLARSRRDRALGTGVPQSVFPAALPGYGKSGLVAFQHSSSTIPSTSFRSMILALKRSSLHASEPSYEGKPEGPCRSHLLAVGELEVQPMYLRDHRLDALASAFVRFFELWPTFAPKQLL